MIDELLRAHTCVDSSSVEYEDIWNKAEFQIHYVDVKGWIHWSRHFGVIRIYQDEKINAGLPPYALFFLSSSAYAWLYPNLETANILASWAASRFDMNGEWPGLLPPERQREANALKKMHGVVQKPFDFIYRTDDGVHGSEIGTIPRGFTSWEEYWESRC